MWAEMTGQRRREEDPVAAAGKPLRARLAVVKAAVLRGVKAAADCGEAQLLALQLRRIDRLSSPPQQQQQHHGSAAATAAPTAATAAAVATCSSTPQLLPGCQAVASEASVLLLPGCQAVASEASVLLLEGCYGSAALLCAAALRALLLPEAEKDGVEAPLTIGSTIARVAELLIQADATTEADAAVTSNLCPAISDSACAAVAVRCLLNLSLACLRRRTEWAVCEQAASAALMLICRARGSAGAGESVSVDDGEAVPAPTAPSSPSSPSAPLSRGSSVASRVVKALYRRGLARTELGRCDDAVTDLDRAARLLEAEAAAAACEAALPAHAPVLAESHLTSGDALITAATTDQARRAARQRYTLLRQQLTTVRKARARAAFFEKHATG
jgi:hypothetical protein